MTSPALLTLSQKLTTTSSLLLERSRVLSLNLPPSASSQNQIVRNLTVIRNQLDKLEMARNSGQGKEQDREMEEELGQQYDRLLDMFGEDEVGREKGKALRREKRYVRCRLLLHGRRNVMSWTAPLDFVRCRRA
jgi:syntaxin 8